ncbi:MAG: NRAMP family divalent metal transporter [Burkholderiales bacterium]
MPDTNKVADVALGVVTSVGGFLEIGSIATAAEAGARFGYQLLWAIVLGGVCVTFLVEQSGRLSAVSGQPLAAAIRERFGFKYYFVLLSIIALVTLLVLAAELGGICIALEFATGIAYRWWVIPAMLVTWLLLWKGNFTLIEQGVSLLGLVTVCFVVAAFKLGPDWARAVAGVVPTLPEHDSTRYWYLAVSILGATISPYLFFFYSSGAIEDKWDTSYLGANRAIAGIGMGFGTVISVAVLILASLVLLPRGYGLEHYSQLAVLLDDAFGRWGLILVACSLAIACLGAALEIALAIAYMLAQGLGWNWSEDPSPRREARFCCTYTIVVVLAAVCVIIGPDPLQLTNASMALTAATLPVAIVPFLFVMNDRRYVDVHTNRRLSNTVVLFSIILAFVLAVVTIPLEIFAGG